MIYSTVNHQKLPSSDPTHPLLWWRNTWMVPELSTTNAKETWSLFWIKSSMSFARKKALQKTWFHLQNSNKIPLDIFKIKKESKQNNKRHIYLIFALSYVTRWNNLTVYKIQFWQQHLAIFLNLFLFIIIHSENKIVPLIL